MKRMAMGIWAAFLAGTMLATGCAGGDQATPAKQAFSYEAPAITVVAQAPGSEAALRFDAPTIVVSARPSMSTVALRYDAPAITVTAQAPRTTMALRFDAPTITVSARRAAPDRRLAGNPTPAGSLL